MNKRLATKYDKTAGHARPVNSGLVQNGNLKSLYLIHELQRGDRLFV
jgi:hypothetical protein